MEVVEEDVEEHVLRLLLATEELHVVHDEDVHQLVEVGEVVDAVVAHRVNELVRELLRVDVEDRLLREAVLDFNSDRVGEVGLSESNRAVDQQRIEGRAARFWATANPALRAKRLLSPSMKFSKLYFGLRLESMFSFLRPWNHEGILDPWCLRCIHRHANGPIADCGIVGRRQLDRVRGRSCSGLLHDDGVFQPGILAEFLPMDLRKEST